jgi:NAD(P)-dependent dehydrogenase (short-subunit alcohol dehydrogenase family)
MRIDGSGVPVRQGGWDVLDTAHAQRRMEALLGTPAIGGNRLQVLRNGDEIFPAMVAAIEGAQHSVDLPTYVYWTGRPAQAVAHAVAERARAGVAVRVLIDAIGGIPMDPQLTALMTDAGADVQQSQDEGVQAISADQIARTFRTNVFAMVWIVQAALEHLPAGAAIVTKASIQGFQPSTHLLDYAMTKAAIVNFTHGLASQVLERGIRVNGVAPGPVWTPLIPATMDEERVASFGTQAPMGRAAQPAELAPAYVFLACNDSSYVTGEVLGVTGGQQRG